MNAGALLHEGLNEIGGPCEHLRPFQLVILPIIARLACDASYTVDLNARSSTRRVRRSVSLGGGFSLAVSYCEPPLGDDTEKPRTLWRTGAEQRCVLMC